MDSQLEPTCTRVASEQIGFRNTLVGGSTTLEVEQATIRGESFEGLDRHAMANTVVGRYYVNIYFKHEATDIRNEPARECSQSGPCPPAGTRLKVRQINSNYPADAPGVW